MRQGADQVTVRAGTADRSSLASKIRGWKDDATGLEQRLKDLETIARSLRRRWWLVGTGLVLGLIGWAVGAVRTRPGTMVLVAGGGLILNALLGMINERGWYRWWLIYALALLDVALVAVLIVWFGPGGFVVAFLISVLPYAFDQGHTVGNFLVLTAALAYLAAVQTHYALYGGDAALATGPVLETVTLMVVAMTLKEIPATLIQRIRRTRSIMGEAEHGLLAVRAAALESDELGFLEKSFNKMIEEIGGTISTVQREADEVAAFAEELAASAEELHATSETVTHTAQQLAGDLGKQRDMAEGARGESVKAADQAEALRVRAELMQADAGRLVAAAERGRERVARASQTLRTVGEEVRATASTVAGLGPQSGAASAWRAPARRSARWARKCAPRRRRWRACRGCRSGSACSRRPLRGSHARHICSRSTRPWGRRGPRSMGKGSPSWRTRCGRSPRRRGSRRVRWPSSCPSCAPASTPPRGACRRGKRRCATSGPSPRKRTAPSRSCTRASSSWATW